MVSKYHPRGMNLVTESTSIAEAMGAIWSSSCSQLCQYPHHETKVISNNNTTPLLHCNNYRELIDGIVVMDKDGNPLGKSRVNY